MHTILKNNRRINKKQKSAALAPLLRGDTLTISFLRLLIIISAFAACTALNIYTTIATYYLSWEMFNSLIAPNTPKLSWSPFS